MTTSNPQQTSAYHTLDLEGVRTFIASLPSIAGRLGGTPEDWHVREVSDGNLNMVFLAEGPQGGICLKQALPHVRVDPTWKMPLDRTFFEASWLRAIFPHVPDLTTECLHFDAEQFILIVPSLSGHTVMRTALMAGQYHPAVAAQVGDFVARSTFATSLLAEPFERVMDRRICFARNQTLTRITVDLILIDPYHDHPRNHWADPQLTPIVAALRNSPSVLARIDSLRLHFLSAPQALLHGDLHTGSIMTNGTDTRIIDGEFATYGPIGFDAGLFVGNLILSFFATPDRAGQAAHLDMIQTFWTSFTKCFLDLWQNREWAEDRSTLYYATTDKSTQNFEKSLFIQNIFQDMLGFCATEIIRRLVGYAHIADFSVLTDQPTRTTRQKAALLFAKDCLEQKKPLKSLADFLELLYQNLSTP
ncbi:S-methyl-5-thioribose kinase [Acetobacter orleanensis]|uniref:S-methyl-5-thioribose kinase n=1 Tax=Acetobacter orleanensis TaxID=104099 RepID=A0A4Y3TNB2_9PROT|nr:S-methyl-5-thioribose kinase [Acetobacter orleanensis]KXV62431.1 methylthioribose kinase [Acetobacter orleanensis]PCD79346.1 S-methyl-5-thioribose kinase [Acetobacter orleanensis]GAN67680.1 methylthioribose kinase [Acetobacter orleanensis JCM 7639]GBR25017.1 methylthioribose kinase [Acetobacter orleanensis NRIC 0473]GEB82460.1 methylthioribose kinase [Acetobacter orleanensis]